MKIKFKEIKINNSKIIYFIFKESVLSINDRISNASIKPIGFIIYLGDDYYFVELEEDVAKKELIKEFVETCLT